MTPHIPSSSLGEKQSLQVTAVAKLHGFGTAGNPGLSPSERGQPVCTKAKAETKTKIFGQERIQLCIKAPGVHSWLTKYQDLL